MRASMRKIVAVGTLCFAVLLASFAAFHGQGRAQTLPSFRFVAWGDTKSAVTDLSNLSDQAVLLQPKFTIYAGDLESSGFTQSGIATWTRAMNGELTGATTPNGMFDITFPVRGNHDSSNVAGWQAYFEISQTAARVGASNFTTMSGQQDLTYSFDYANSHIIGVDVPGDASGITSAQIAWVDSDLAAAEGRGLQHAFLYFHGPIYCVDGHCTCTVEVCSIPSAVKNLITVLNKHPIFTAGFFGHEHTYAYTYIDASRIPPETSFAGVTHPFHQIVAGDAGAGPKTCNANRCDYNMPTHGFVTVDVSGPDVTVSFYEIGKTAPVKIISFSNNGGPNPTSTGSGATATRTATRTPGPTSTRTHTPTITPTPYPTVPPTVTASPDGRVVVEVRVASGGDDAEEKVDTGVMDLTSSDLELVREASDQLTGIRFASLAVPQGATILRSYVQFTVDEATSETTNLLFRAQDSDTTAAFTSTSRDISSRPSTSVSVAWNNVAAWNTVGESGIAQTSPSLSPLIQAIVDRPGWTQGNAFTLLISGSGKRVAKSFNGSSASAALLHVEYMPPSQESTFADVPFGHAYFDEIEWLYRNGYTAGCGTNPLRYCPDATMNRAESAVYVERGIHSASYDPPTPGSQIFADLPLDSWAAKWVNGLWQDQFTVGCGTNPLVYCPWQGHTRAEGTVFYLRMLHGAAYQPPEPTVQRFSDVPLGVWYAKWVEAAYLAGLIPACQNSPELRFCPDDPLSRSLAAYMMYQAKTGPTPPATPTTTPPTPGAGQWYRGNSHTHSSLSDTSTSDNTATIAGWYKAAGYDFLIISDHNNDVATKQIFCHDNLSTSTFLMLCGNELSYSTHTLAFNIDQFIKGETSLQDAVTRALNAGGVPIANHPQDSGVTATKFLGTIGLNHFEVVNGGRLGDTAAHEALWDAILSASNGRIAYGVASDDNHSCSSCVGRGWIMVKAPALTKQDIEDNFRSGNFYATTGIILNDYVLDRAANTITVDSQNGETITFIGNNGSVLRTVQGRVATYQVVGTEKYVRVKITNAAGKAAWTQPVYVADF